MYQRPDSIAALDTCEVETAIATPAAALSAARPRFYPGTGKRLLDLGLVLASAAVTLPVVLLLALAIWLRDGRNPIFGHMRVGRAGQPFRCWKLRTMVPDAERRLKTLLENDAAARREWEAGCKLARDPRITRFGAFLRRTSLDELPQLWNVLMGEMSLVGARPVTAGEMARYGIHAEAYRAQRPGLTGLWQVGGRNDLSYEARVAMDRAYLARISLGTDLRLILATIGVVLRRTGR